MLYCDKVAVGIEESGLITGFIFFAEWLAISN